MTFRQRNLIHTGIDTSPFDTSTRIIRIYIIDIGIVEGLDAPKHAELKLPARNPHALGNAMTEELEKKGMLSF
jgi:hypothetical protein